MAQPEQYDEGLATHTNSGVNSDATKLTTGEAATFWTEQLMISDRDHQDYLEEADEVVEMYRKAKRRTKQKSHRSNRRRMNVLYANTETLRGAVFARPGQPDVRPRWNTIEDPMVVNGSLVMERALSFSVDKSNYTPAVKLAVLQAVLTNRGVIRCEYEPQIKNIEVEDETGEMVTEEAIADQKVNKVVVNRHDFRHSPAECWEDVWWIGWRHKFTKHDMEENAFENIDDIPMTWTSKRDEQGTDHEDDQQMRAEVWEVWSKLHMKRFFIVKNYGKLCRAPDDDPYGLENFFPMPPPLMFGPRLDTLVPDLEWTHYSALADDLENIVSRIAVLTAAMRRRGVRDGKIEELAKLAKAGDNEFVPVENYAQLVKAGGLNGAYEVEDIEQYVKALTELYRAQAETEARIDKLSGIADVMRGNVDPGEKLGQTELKTQFGGLRITTRKNEVEDFIRNLMRVEGELMVEHFEPDMLSRMTGIEVTEEMMDMLRDDATRSYMIDIETDSTVMEDTEGQKRAMSEAVQATSSLLQVAIPVMQQEPELGEVVFELIGQTLRTIKGGRSIEQAIDKAKQDRQKRMQAQAQQPPPPDPKMEAEKAKAQAAQEQAVMKTEAQQMQNDAKLQQTEMEMERSGAEHQNKMDEQDMKRVVAFEKQVQMLANSGQPSKSQ